MKRILPSILGFCLLLLSASPYAAIPVSFKVEGVSNAKALKNIRNTLDNMLTWLPIPTAESAVKQFTQTAPAKIKHALEPYGYFHATVQTTLKQDKKNWVAVFNVTPGPAVKVTRVTLKIKGPGQGEPFFQQYRQTFPIKIGDTLLTEKYNQAKSNLLSVASQHGYFSGKLKRSKILINLHNNTAQINIDFNTGPRYRFGTTTFSKTPFSSTFLNRFLAYKAGELYDVKKVTLTQEHYTNTPYFAQVIVTPEVNQKTKNRKGQYIVPMHVSLMTQPRSQYIFGLGYGSDTGVRGTLGINLRYVNAYGHRFKTLIQASQRNSQLVASYFIPGSNPVTDQWVFTSALARIVQTNANSNAFKLAASYTTRGWGWDQTYSVNYLNENYNLTGFPNTQANMIYPSIDWTRLRVDNKVKPQNGYSLSMQLAGTPASFGETSDGFFQGRLNASSLTTLGNRTRLLFRAQGGHTEINSINQLPLSLQLYAGGARSVRGYTWNSIGPGRNLFVASAEIQERVYGNWYIGAFYDVGNVADNNLFKNLNEGVGPAIIWLSPVGALELSVAKALSTPGQPWKVQFSMGPVL